MTCDGISRRSEGREEAAAAPVRTSPPSHPLGDASINSSGYGSQVTPKADGTAYHNIKRHVSERGSSRRAPAAVYRRTFCSLPLRLVSEVGIEID